MQSEFRMNGVTLEKDLFQYFDRRLSFGLSRFGPQISKVIVYLADNNGPKGGIDKSCQIIVRLRRAREVIAKAVDSDWRFAIDRAAATIAQNLRRELKRVRERGRGSIAAARIVDAS